MLAGSDFVLLPGERKLFSSLPRTAFSLESRNKYPATKDLVNLSSPLGTVHITNKRVCLLLPMQRDRAVFADRASLDRLSICPTAKQHNSSLLRRPFSIYTTAES